MNPIMTGKLIQRLRKEKQYTQSELASMLGISNKAISRWETGDGYPDVTLLLKLASILEVSVEALLKGEADRPPKPANIPAYYRLKNAMLVHYFVIGLPLLLGVILNNGALAATLGFGAMALSLLWVLLQRNQYKALSYGTARNEQLIYTTLRDSITPLIVYLGFFVPSFLFAMSFEGGWLPYLPFGLFYAFVAYVGCYLYFAFIYERGKYTHLRNRYLLRYTFYGLVFANVFLVDVHALFSFLPSRRETIAFPILTLYLVFTFYEWFTHRNLMGVPIVRLSYITLLFGILFVADWEYAWVTALYILYILFGLFFVIGLVVKITRFTYDAEFRLYYHGVLMTLYYVFVLDYPRMTFIILFVIYVLVDRLIASHTKISTIQKDTEGSKSVKFHDVTKTRA